MEMRKMFTGTIIAALHDRKGVSAMEYAILAAAILTAVGAAAITLAGDISGLLIKLGDAITALTV
jgi:Flp pilus assembly pilin Flp